MTHDQGQHSFTVVLGEADGDERFITAVMADDRQQAVEKAALLAERLGIEVELVEPVENLPMVARPTENEGRARETDGAGHATALPTGGQVTAVSQ